MTVYRYGIVFIFFLLYALTGLSQTEDQTKEEADKLFDQERYLDATPLYVRLISMKPRSTEYNFKFGACLLYNSNRKLEAVRYLNFANTDATNLPPDFHYYYGRALHLNYQFNDAIREFNLYKTQRNKANKQFEVDREIQLCENGKKLMTTITDIIVTDKKEISKDKFFRIYDLSNIGGTLLVTAEFQTKVDKKNEHIPLIHFPSNPTVIYYSSYGEKGDRGKDIYVRRKLPDGSWGEPQALPGEVNTQFDEDFPYMHPDGDYLYFSSKGHNSMGGYDVFRAKYDKETNSFGKPENMDFAISSPDDDIFYVVDSLNKDAVFASSRQSQEGFYHVYKVKVDRVPIQMAVVKGEFLSQIDAQIKDIDFTIRDYSNGDFIGKFNSNDKGSYLITFPKGGKYEFIMTVNDGSQEFRSIVSIPFMKEFKPLKQKIVHYSDNGTDAIKVVNQFDENFDDPSLVLAEVIQTKSALEVNVNEYDLNKIEEKKIANNILNELGLGNLNLIEVSYILEQKVQKGVENKTFIENLTNNINNLVVENSAEFLKMEEDIKAKVAEANTTTDADRKYLLLRESELLIQEQQALKTYSKDLLHLSDSVNQVLDKSSSGKDFDKLRIITNEFENLFNAGREEDALNLLSTNKSFLLAVLKDSSANLIQNLVDRSIVFDDEIVKMKSRIDQYNRDIKESELQIQSLNNSLSTAKKKEAEEMTAKIAEKEEEILLIQEERDLVQRSIEKKDQEKFMVTEQIELLQDAVSNRSLGTVDREESEKALAQTEKTNTNTLNSYVNQQIAEMEKKDPEIKNRVIITSGSTAQAIYKNYNASNTGISDDNNLSKEDKLYKQLQNERTTIKSLEKREKELNEQLAKNPDNSQLLEEKQQIQTLKKDINSSISVQEKQVEMLLSKNGTVAANQTANAVKPGYSDKQKSIRNDNTLSNEAKLKALNTEDQKLVQAIDQELSQVNAKLQTNPADAESKKRQETLLALKSTTQTAIKDRTSELQIAGVEQYTPQKMKKDLLPGYDAKKQEIQSNTNYTDYTKAQLSIREDEQLISKIDAELLKVNAGLKQNPSDASLQQKKESLEQLRREADASILAKNDEIARFAKNQPVKTDEQLRMELSASYQKNTETLKKNSSLSAAAKLNALKAEEEKLIAASNKKLEELKQQQLSNPQDPVITKQIEQLLQVVAASEKTKEAYQQQLDKGSEVTLVASKEEMKESLLSDVTATDERTKNEELSKRADAELVQIEEELKKDPSNATLQAKQIELQQIKDEALAANGNPPNKETNVSGNSGKTTDKQNDQKLVFASVELQKSIDLEHDRVQSDKNLNAQQKLEALKAIDSKFLTSVKKEEGSLQEKLKISPSDADLVQEKQALQTMSSQLSASIEQTNKELQELTTNKAIETSSAEQIAVIRSDNSNAKAEISTSTSLTETQKLTALNKEDQKSIQALEAEVAKLEARKSTASSTEKQALEASIAALNKEKEELSTSIEERNTQLSLAENKEVVAQQNSAETNTKPEVAVVSAKEITQIQEDRKAEISTSTSLTETQKLTALNKEDQKSIQALEAEVAKLEARKSTASSSEKQALEASIAALNKEKGELSTSIEERNTQLSVAENKEVVAQQNSAETNTKPDVAVVSAKEIKQTQEDRKAEISTSTSLTETQKLTALNKEDQKSIQALEVEVAKLEARKSTASSSEKQALEASIAALNKEKEELSTSIEERNTQLSVAANKEVVVQQNSAGTNTKPDVAVVSAKEITQTQEDRKAEISTSTSLTETQKLTALNKEDQKSIQALEAEVAKLEVRKSTASSSEKQALEASIAALNKEKDALKDTLSARQNQLNIAAEQKEQRTNSTEVLRHTLLQDQESKKSEITASTFLSETDKKDALNKEDQRSLEIVRTENKAVMDQLKKDPNNSSLKQRSEALKSIETELVAGMDARNKSASNDKQETVGSRTNKEEDTAKGIQQKETVTSSETVTKTQTKYQEQLSSIDANIKLTDVQKNSAKQVLTEQYIRSIDTEIATLKKQLEADPTNENVQAQISNLETDRVVKESELSELQQTVYSQVAKDIRSEDRLVIETKLLRSASGSYVQDSINLAKSVLPETAKLEGQRNLTSSLLENLKKEQNVLTVALQKDPTNEQKLKEQQVISDLIIRKEEENKAINLAITNKTEPREDVPVSTEKSNDAVLNEIAPNYSSALQSLEDNKTLTEEDKKEQQLMHHEQALSAVEIREEVLKTRLSEDPENLEAKRELEQVDALRKELEAKIETMETSLYDSKLSTLSETEKNKTIATLDPEYSQKVKTINGDMNLSRTARLQALQTEDQRLLSEVYNQQEKVEDYLDDHPGDTKKQQESDRLDAIAVSLERKVEERQLLLVEEDARLQEESAKANLIDALSPSYQQTNKEISASSRSEFQKLQSLQTNDERLIAIAKDKMIEVNRLLSTDPSNEEAQEQKALLESIIREKEENIAYREERTIELASNGKGKQYLTNQEIEKIDPGFTARKKEIESHSELTAEERQNQLLALEHELLDKVSGRRVSVEQRLKSDPENVDLLAERAELNKIERDITTDVEKRKSEVSSAISVEKVVDAIRPDYRADKKELLQSRMEEGAKLSKELILEKDLLAALSEQLDSAQSVSKENPTDAETRAKVEVLQKAVRDQQNTVNQLNGQIAYRADEQQKLQLREEIQPQPSDLTSQPIDKQLKVEEELQKKLNQRIATNTKELKKNPNEALQKENELLQEMLEESKDRSQLLRPTTSVFLQDKRKELLAEQEKELTKEYTTKEDLLRQDQILAVYEKQLQQELEKEKNTEFTKEKEAHLSDLTTELQFVQAKRRKARIAIGELEKLPTETTDVSNEKSETTSALKAKEEQLNSQLSEDGLSTKEKEKLVNELNEVRVEQQQAEISVQQQRLSEQQQKITTLEPEIKGNVSVQLMQEQQQLQKEALTIRSEQLNNSKKNEQKAYELEKLAEKQTRNNDRSYDVIVQAQLTQLEKENGVQLQTADEVEQQKRIARVRVGELEREIVSLEQQLSTVKKKDKAAIEQQLIMVKKELDIAKKQLELTEQKQVPSTTKITSVVDRSALKTSITVEEERELAMSDSYEGYVRKAAEVIAVETQITNLESSIAAEKNAVKEQIKQNAYGSTESMKQQLQAIQEKERQLTALQQEHEAKKVELAAVTPQDKEEAMKMQNMLIRGIQPVQKAIIAAAIVQLPAAGFSIERNEATEPGLTKSPIPVDVKSPSGLVYRVQVGAFSKPIPPSLFHEFKPVTGETVNTGITRYLAGYFNNSASVLEARKQIQTLGYKDAFPIAYCDGKRISIAEAKRLEALKLCLPKGGNELNVEVALNIAESTGAIDSIVAAGAPIPAIDEAMAPDALKAEPIERHLGLFYTVQVGAFTRASSAKILEPISPLYSLRLPNGQTRYSAGMFNSVDEARPKKQDCIDKGVKDAFITAYFKGQRITLAEADKLLADNGKDILELNKPVAPPSSVAPGKGTAASSNPPGTKVVPGAKKEVVMPEIKVEEVEQIETYQFVSKATYDEFPREILNRYNSHGSYYYDNQDKHVKSTLFTKKEDLPQVYYFKNDVDTVSKVVASNKELPVIEIKVNATILPGEFADWMVRYHYRREFNRDDSSIKVQLFDVPEEQLPVLEKELAVFGLTFSKATITVKELRTKEE